MLWFTALSCVSLVRSQQGEPHPCCTSDTKEGSQHGGICSGEQQGDRHRVRQLLSPLSFSAPFRGTLPWHQGPWQGPRAGWDRGRKPGPGEHGRAGRGTPQGSWLLTGDRNSHAQLPGEQAHSRDIHRETLPCSSDPGSVWLAPISAASPSCCLLVTSTTPSPLGNPFPLCRPGVHLKAIRGI